MTDLPPEQFNDEIEKIIQSDSASLSNFASNDAAVRVAAYLTQTQHPHISSTARADILQQVLDTMPVPTSDTPKVKARPQIIRPAFWTTVLKAAVGFIAILLVSGLIAVPASANSVPGEALYPIKRHAEALHLFLSFTPEARADVHLTHAQRRVNETNELVNRNVLDKLPVVDGTDSLYDAIDVALANNLYDDDVDLLLQTEELLVTYFDLVEILSEDESLSNTQIINHWRDEVNFAAQAIYDVNREDLNKFGCEGRGNSCNTPANSNNNANGNRSGNSNGRGR